MEAKVPRTQYLREVGSTNPAGPQDLERVKQKLRELTDRNRSQWL